MTTFINILTILSLLLGIFTIIVITWTNKAIKRRKQGLKDFEKIPFFAKETIIETDINIETKDSHKKTYNKKNTKRNNYIFSFNIHENQSCETTGKMAIN